MVRAGYGMFYAKTTNSTWYAVRVENGVFQQTFNCSPVPTSASYCPSLTFPNVIFTPPGATPQAPFPGALTPQVTPFTPPSATQLSHGVYAGLCESAGSRRGSNHREAAARQPEHLHRLPHEPRSASAGLRGWKHRNPPTTTHTYDILNSSNAVIGTATEPFYTSANRINPTTGIILVGQSVINSWYNAGVLTIRKPMSHGLELLMNYTYSRSIDDGAVAGTNGTFFGTDPPVDPLNQRRENSLSDLDQRHRFVGSVVYIPQFFNHVRQ